MSRLKWILCRAGGTNSHSFLALTSQLTNAKLKEETLQRYKFTDIVLGLTFDKSSQADHFVSFISFTHYWLHNTKIKSTERPTIQKKKKKKFGEQSHFPFLAAIGPPKILYFVSYIYLFYRLEKVFASGWSQKQNLMPQVGTVFSYYYYYFLEDTFTILMSKVKTREMSYTNY